MRFRAINHPRQPRPIVAIETGGIVRDAHLPAYGQAFSPGSPGSAVDACGTMAAVEGGYEGNDAGRTKVAHD